MPLELPNWNALLRLKEPRWWRLPDSCVERPIAELRNLAASLPDGIDSADNDLIEEVRIKLRVAARSGQTFEQATETFARREWRLILLYTLDLGQDAAISWLPPLDDAVAQSILGDDPMAWHSARRRDVTQLFFTQFGHERFTALPLVAAMLRKAWKKASAGVFDEAALKWAQNAIILFAKDGPVRLADMWLAPESVNELADRYYIHENGGFRKHLLQAVLLRRLRKLAFGGEDEALFSILEKDKKSPAGEGRLLGSWATEIILKRVMGKSGASWSDSWRRCLVSFGCDPRLPDPAERSRWWAWATEAEKRVAIQALMERDFSKFIEFLGASLSDENDRDKFHKRKNFLLNDLLGSRRVEDVQLLVFEESHRKLDHEMRQAPSVTEMIGKINSCPLSLIILKCTGNVSIVEGTHNFGIRCYLGNSNALIERIWKRPRTCDSNQLHFGREDQPDCFYQSHQGDWISGFYYKLNTRLDRAWRRIS